MWQAVELRELRAFLALAEELHFGRAAERLHIDRSRVSQIINELETKVGGRLFERTSRRVRLTPIGEQLVDEVAGPYRELREAFLRARQATIGVAGTLRLGMYLPTNGGRYLAEIVRAFKAEHPAAGVELVDTGLEHDDLEWLRGGEVDVLATRLPATGPDLTVGPILSSEPRVLLVSRTDPLAARASICLEDLGDRLVTDNPPFRRELVDALIPPVTPSGRHIRRVPTRSIEDLLLRVAVGDQVHPTVASLLDYVNHPEITCVGISDMPPSETALVWLTANESPKLQAFASAAERVLATHCGAEDHDFVPAGEAA